MSSVEALSSVETSGATKGLNKTFFFHIKKSSNYVLTVHGTEWQVASKQKYGHPTAGLKKQTAAERREHLENLPRIPKFT